VVIVDAGGGTVDISSYSRNQQGNFEEIAAPQCSFVFITLKINNFRSYIPGHFHGSVFVTTYAKRFLESMSLPN
jgi:hypothetical protein